MERFGAGEAAGLEAAGGVVVVSGWGNSEMMALYLL